MREDKRTKPEKWILWGIPAIFLLGALFHFTYNLLGKGAWAGTFSAVNESTWEHMKLAVFPTLFWWIGYYILKKQNYSICAGRWFWGALTSLLTSLLLIPLLFYGYTQALGVGSTVVDILIFLVAVLAGQLLGLHVYRYGTAQSSLLPLILLVFIGAAFLVFTFSTPQIPLFRDPISGRYGIG